MSSRIDSLTGMPRVAPRIFAASSSLSMKSTSRADSSGCSESAATPMNMEGLKYWPGVPSSPAGIGAREIPVGTRAR